MNDKTSAKDVKRLQQWGQENEVVKQLIDKQVQPNLFYIGSYWPSNANWAWLIGICIVNGKHYELLTRFGAVEGGRLIYMPTEEL